MAEVWVALPRGINVGGKNKLPMKELAHLFASYGCQNVRTYIQSGNVIYEAPAGVDAKIGAAVSRGIAERWGYDVPVVTRRAEELARIVGDSPFASADPAHVAIAFLKRKPSASGIAKLNPDRSPPDRFAVIGREIHLHLPNGAARSKLTNRYFDTTLGTVSTVRNWRTVNKLIDLSSLS